MKNMVIDNIFKCLLDLPNTGVSFNKFRENNVFDIIYKKILLKYRTVDSIFIQNRQEFIKKNDYLLSNKEKQKNNLIREQNKLLLQNKQIRENYFTLSFCG